MIEGHGEPCYYCKAPINNLSARPSEWGLCFPHVDEPGVPKFQHTGCVTDRLLENNQDLLEERARLDWREAHPRHGFGLYVDGEWADGLGGSHKSYRDALDAARGKPKAIVVEER